MIVFVEFFLNLFHIHLTTSDHYSNKCVVISTETLTGGEEGREEKKKRKFEKGKEGEKKNNGRKECTGTCISFHDGVIGIIGAYHLYVPSLTCTVSQQNTQTYPSHTSLDEEKVASVWENVGDHSSAVQLHIHAEV